jgi:tryptophan synthase alpha chain
VVPYLLVDRNHIGRLAATVRSLRDAGAVALELGFPFSDPIADGPVLEAAVNVALEHGTSWHDLLGAVRVASPILPTAVMTYANPVWRHGLVPAVRALASVGASGLIVPDLSYEDSAPWRAAARSAGLSLVLLAAPGSPPARVGAIARAARGFLYLVGYYGTTGRRTSLDRSALVPIVDAAHRSAPDLPVLLGFGIRDAASARLAMRTGVDGVVVGTALELAIQRDSRPASVGRWFRPLIAAVSSPVTRSALS